MSSDIQNKQQQSLNSDSYIKKQNAKLIQVIQNFFTKSAQIILEARTLQESPNSTTSLFYQQTGSTSTNDNQKLNKWFNLNMYSPSDFMKDELKLWSPDLSNIPPMIIETYLDLRQLPNNQTVVLIDDNNNSWTVTKSGGKKHEVVLERWLIEFDQKSASSSIVDELPLIYKQAIILFRSIYGFTRLMPTFKLKKKLQSDGNNKLSLGNKILDGNQPISSKGRIGLSKSIIPQQALPTESHMTQKMFQPINTSLGTLKISIAYRTHYNFKIQANEEILSTHFISIDKEHHHQQQQQQKELEQDKDLLLKEEEREGDTEEDLTDKPVSQSLSPCTSELEIAKEASYPPKTSNKLIIQPFKVGAMSTSPPPSNIQSSSLERRISITSNRSGSSASLAAFLRNPRSSTPAVAAATASTTMTPTTSANIPITNANASQQQQQHNVYGGYNSSFPRSIGSSTGHEDSMVDSSNNTPRFSSSFGSRASRRFSNTSLGKQQTPDLGMGRSTSVDETLSGLYGDDDISEFVRMIDSKSDLKFSTSSFNINEQGTPSSSSTQQQTQQQHPHLISNDSLNKFQLLRSQHQQLSDNVSASVILHQRQQLPGSNTSTPSTPHGIMIGNAMAGSRPSSRKSSLNSPPASIGSYDQQQQHHNHQQQQVAISSIHSRMRRESSPRARRELDSNTDGSRHSFMKTSTPLPAPVASLARMPNSPVRLSVSPPAASKKKEPVAKATATTVISGLATTPSIYSNRRSITYEDVFDDEEDENDDHENDDCDDDNGNKKEKKKLLNPTITVTGGGAASVASAMGGKKSSISSSSNHQDDEDEDDLLFTMSDMNSK